MSEAETRRERIRGKVAASAARLKRESQELPAVPERKVLPDAYPPESYRSLAGEYPWLTMAAGLGAGLLVGALVPKAAGGKLGKRAFAVASLAAEFGLALSRRAGAEAEERGRDGLRRVSEAAAPLRQRAARSTRTARDTGLVLAREALKLAARRRGN